MRVRPGSPHPLGATWDGRGTNFAIFSAHADQAGQAALAEKRQEGQ